MFDLLSLLAQVESRIRPPVGIILGSPHQAADLVARLPAGVVTCYQLDLYLADRLREQIAEIGQDAQVVTLPDLWDLPPTFNTLIFPNNAHGERELKLDLLEQSFHALQPGGMLLTLSEYQKDQVIPKWHKKVFGKCSELPPTRKGSIFWSIREGERPKRRHEITFHARIGEGPSHSFISRPGVFSYGSMDMGARALVECAAILPEDRILDLGCGVGTNGVLAMDRAGPEGHVTFLDSNVRAAAVAEINARANGLTSFKTVAAYSANSLPRRWFDVVLANPPYYANSTISRRFIEESRPLLREGGRFYLVTKQVRESAPIVVEVFGEAVVHEHRRYGVLEAMIPETL
jgi:16S rRNA (guanine1207-N2)-methyltransferase